MQCSHPVERNSIQQNREKKAERMNSRRVRSSTGDDIVYHIIPLDKHSASRNCNALSCTVHYMRSHHRTVLNMHSTPSIVTYLPTVTPQLRVSRAVSAAALTEGKDIRNAYDT
jgi:hypothetical protein